MIQFNSLGFTDGLSLFINIRRKHRSEIALKKISENQNSLCCIVGRAPRLKQWHGSIKDAELCNEQTITCTNHPPRNSRAMFGIKQGWIDVISAG